MSETQTTLSAAEVPAAAAPVVAAPAHTAAATDSLLSTATVPGTEAPATPAADAPKAVEAPVVPDAYTFNLPEGASIDEAMSGEYSATLKDAGLTQAQADKLTPFLAAKMQEMQSAAMRAWETTNAGWISAVKSDPEIGGAKWDASRAEAARALDAFGGPELREALNLTGGGNNPAIIKAFVKIGRAMSDDQKFVNGKTGSAPADRGYDGIASRFYNK